MADFLNEAINLFGDGQGQSGYLVHQEGYNGAVGTSLEEVTNKNAAMVYLTAAELIEAVSTAAADAAAGTGARTVSVYGLDGDYKYIEQSISLDGATPVAVTTAMIRVWGARVTSAGSGGTNAGVITITNAAGSNDLLTIAIGLGIATAALYTVPYGCSFFIRNWWGVEPENKKSDIELWVRPYGEAWQIWKKRTITLGEFQEDIYFLKIPARADISIKALSAGGSGKISAGFAGFTLR